MGLPLVIADLREKKILKRFKVTPVSPVMILFVYLMLYVLYAVVSLVTLFLIATAGWKMRVHGSMLAFLGSWLLTMISTLSIGLMVGGLAKNSKIAGVAASLLYFPMLVFSGTTLPFEVMPKVMQMVVKMFPMTQGIQLMKASFLGEEMVGGMAGAGNGNGLAILVMMVVTVICSLIAVKCFKWE